MNKLYKVTIELMAIGVDEFDALCAASHADLHACETEVEEVTNVLDILDGWEDVLPWGEYDGRVDLTCSNIITAWNTRRGE